MTIRQMQLNHPINVSYVLYWAPSETFSCLYIMSTDNSFEGKPAEQLDILPPNCQIQTITKLFPVIVVTHTHIHKHTHYNVSEEKLAMT